MIVRHVYPINFRALKKGPAGPHQKISLKDSGNNLPGNKVSSDGGNDAKHSSPTINKLNNTKLLLERFVFIHNLKQ
jgi:hypothetical protein